MNVCCIIQISSTTALVNSSVKPISITDEHNIHIFLNQQLHVLALKRSHCQFVQGNM